VEGGEEVGGHGSAIGGDGLVFYGTNFDDAGVVDEDVDATEVDDGLVDDHGGLGGVGEVGGEKKDVVGGLEGFAIEEGLAGGDELVGIAGGEDESGSGAGVTLGQSEAEAAGAAGDKDDFAWAHGGARVQHEGDCCGGGNDASENLHGMEGGSGLLHSFSDAERGDELRIPEFG
jgi:hypothetical protein